MKLSKLIEEQSKIGANSRFSNIIPLLWDKKGKSWWSWSRTIKSLLGALAFMIDRMLRGRASLELDDLLFFLVFSSRSIKNCNTNDVQCHSPIVMSLPSF